MEKPYGGRQEVIRRPIFKHKFLSRMASVLSRRRTETSISASARFGAVKLAADPSLAMTSSGRTAWSGAIVGKYLFRFRKAHCQQRLLKSRGNLYRIRPSAYAETRQSKTTFVCKKFARPILRTASRKGHNCEEGAGGTVASRMQTLRLLVPGSRGLDTPVFLKKAADYILALKKRVQAMQALAECYSDSNVHSTCEILV